MRQKRWKICEQKKAGQQEGQQMFILHEPEEFKSDPVVNHSCLYGGRTVRCGKKTFVESCYMITFEMMKVNGEERSLADLKSPDIPSLLELYGINPAGVAIEINGQVIPRQKWSDVKLKGEDQVELIRFVGGG